MSSAIIKLRNEESLQFNDKNTGLQKWTKGGSYTRVQLTSYNGVIMLYRLKIASHPNFSYCRAL